MRSSLANDGVANASKNSKARLVRAGRPEDLWVAFIMLVAGIAAVFWLSNRVKPGDEVGDSP